jgi:hypothetical protein
MNVFIFNLSIALAHSAVFFNKLEFVPNGIVDSAINSSTISTPVTQSKTDTTTTTTTTDQQIAGELNAGAGSEETITGSTNISTSGTGTSANGADSNATNVAISGYGIGTNNKGTINITTDAQALTDASQATHEALEANQTVALGALSDMSAVSQTTLQDAAEGVGAADTLTADALGVMENMTSQYAAGLAGVETTTTDGTSTTAPTETVTPDASSGSLTNWYYIIGIGVAILSIFYMMRTHKAT